MPEGRGGGLAAVAAAALGAPRLPGRVAHAGASGHSLLQRPVEFFGLPRPHRREDDGPRRLRRPRRPLGLPAGRYLQPLFVAFDVARLLFATMPAQCVRRPRGPPAHRRRHHHIHRARLQSRALDEPIWALHSHCLLLAGRRLGRVCLQHGLPLHWGDVRHFQPVAEELQQRVRSAFRRCGESIEYPGWLGRKGWDLRLRRAGLNRDGTNSAPPPSSSWHESVTAAVVHATLHRPRRTASPHSLPARRDRPRFGMMGAQ
mmetsp:Transcript_95396/g.274715  ORF Transcript_95396/g.274715 Transcript_95396/m.274715 type:complete len:259 (-) Transcript_95396:18-794(-)